MLLEVNNLEDTINSVLEVRYAGVMTFLQKHTDVKNIAKGVETIPSKDVEITAIVSDEVVLTSTENLDTKQQEDNKEDFSMKQVEEISIPKKELTHVDKVNHVSKDERYNDKIIESKKIIKDVPTLIKYIQSKGKNIEIDDGISLFGLDVVQKAIKQGSVYKKKGKLIV